jgi:maltose alpha-D-glucosyltransferase / alpha-amylase
MDPVYGYEAVNVEAQLRNPSSLLHWTRRVIATRRRYKAFGRGAINFLEPGNRKVLAFLREFEDEAMLCVANLSRVPQAVELDLGRFEGRVPVEIFGQEPFPPVGKLPYLITLPAHGYIAFRLATDARPPSWHEDYHPPRRLPVLVLAPDWQQALEVGAGREPHSYFMHIDAKRLRDEVLVPFVRGRRWFAAKNDTLDDVRMPLLASWKTPAGQWIFTFLDVVAGGKRQRYLFPLGIEWETRDHDPMEKVGSRALAKVRRHERVGLLYSAFADTDFPRALARGMGEGGEAKVGPGRLRFSATSLYRELAPAIDGETRIPPLDQSNTAVFFGTTLFLKIYRLLRPGLNPELEMGRFLTDVSPYPHVAPVVGAVEYAMDDPAECYTLAILQRYVDNQGDLWTLTLEHLSRTIMLPGAAPAGTAPKSTDFHLSRMALLGQRVGELHRALCKASGDPAFDPEPVAATDLADWKTTIEASLDATLALAQEAAGRLGEEARGRIAPLFDAAPALRKRIRGTQCRLGDLVKTRYHGDLHMGQVLMSQAEFVIVDFEGEPARSFEERRAKSCVLRDVAGMLRSFSYATHAASLRREPAAAGPDEAITRALADWERGAVQRFRDGYQKAVEGLASAPQDRESFESLLGLFLVEKALYEVRYEIANRPDWIDIPVRGLLELART